MASTITNISKLIDNNFPKPGEGISSVETFQSNFQKIQESFTILSKELGEAVKQNVNLADTNDFGGNIIKRASLQDISYKVNDIGKISNGITNLNFREGVYQKVEVESGYYTFNVTNWSEDRIFNKLRLEVKNVSTTTSSTCYINFSGFSTFLGTLTGRTILSNQSAIFYDIWTASSGNKIYIKPLGDTSEVNQEYISTPAAPSGGGGPLPTITSVGPANWSNLGYESISIFGTNLTTATVFVGESLMTLSSVSSSQIDFVTLPMAVGVTPLTVITPNGSTSTVIFVQDYSYGGGV